MKHYASSRYWQCYNKLPAQLQSKADKKFALLKENPKHPSLHYKMIDN